MNHKKRTTILTIGIIVLLTMPLMIPNSIITQNAKADPTNPHHWSDDITLNDVTHYSIDPAMTVEGSYVYAVWTDGRDNVYNSEAEVYFKRSTDSGETWDNDFRLSHQPVDYERADWPYVAASGDSVYVVWQDDRGIDPEIWINISHDRGITWEGETNLTADDLEWSRNPVVAADGDYVFVTWADERDGTNEIFFRRSTDRGQTWEPERQLTDDSEIGASDNFPKSIIADGNIVHLLFDGYTSGYTLPYYMRSDNYGVDWIDPIKLTTRTGAWCYGYMDVVGTNIYVVWQLSAPWTGEDDTIFRMSNGNGNPGTWGPEIAIEHADNYSYDARICADQDSIHIVYADDNNTGDECATYHSYSTDGTTWSIPNYLSPPIMSRAHILSDGEKIHFVYDSDYTGPFEVYYTYYNKSAYPFQANVNFSEGWNLVNIPCSFPNMMASEWAEMIEANTSLHVLSICDWENGWNDYLRRNSQAYELLSWHLQTDYSLDKRESYMVYVAENTSKPTDHRWECDHLTPYSSAVQGIPIQEGWNNVALPYTSGATRDTDDVLADSNYFKTIAIWNYNTDGWETDPPGGPYSLQNSYNGIGDYLRYANANGLFIYSNTDTTWNPT